MGKRNRYLKMTKNEIGQECFISGLATSHFPECHIPSVRMTTSIHNYVRTLSRRFSKPWIDFEAVFEPPASVFCTSTVFVIEVQSLSILMEIWASSRISGSQRWTCCVRCQAIFFSALNLY